MNPGSKWELAIRRLSDGGFIVHEPPQVTGAVRVDYFASANIDEALSYIKNVLDVKKVEK